MWKYCGIIFKFWFLILCLFFHPYVPFFSLLHFVHHTHIPIISTSSFFFFFIYFHLIPEAPSVFLSPALSFFTLFFFFFPFSTWFHKFASSLCDTWFHNLACLLVSLSSKFKHTQTRMERGEIVFSPPHRHHYSSSSLWSACNQGSYRLLFFFFYLIIYCCSIFFFFLFLIGYCCCFDFRFFV